jgi:hypothetical protein
VPGVLKNINSLNVKSEVQSMADHEGTRVGVAVVGWVLSTVPLIRKLGVDRGRWPSQLCSQFAPGNEPIPTIYSVRAKGIQKYMLMC